MPSTTTKTPMFRCIDILASDSIAALPRWPQLCELGLSRLEKLRISRSFSAPLLDYRPECGPGRIEVGLRREDDRALGVGVQLFHQRAVDGVVSCDEALGRPFARVLADDVLGLLGQAVELLAVHQDRKWSAADPNEIVIGGDASDAKLEQW